MHIRQSKRLRHTALLSVLLLVLSLLACLPAFAAEGDSRSAALLQESSSPDSALQSGWVTLETGRTWLQEDGTPATGWLRYEGAWYYLGTDGILQTGWLQDGSTWYYLNSDGSMKTGWLRWHGSWYYLNRDGTLKTGWLKWYGKWYYLNQDGAMLTGWLQDGENWYYLKAGGAMLTGWLQWSSDWYWFDASGAMVTGQREIDGVRYYFAEDGCWDSDWSPDTETEALEQLVSETISGYSGSWSVYFKNLNTGGSFSLQDTPMVSASLIKLFIYGAAGQAIEAGTLSDSVYTTYMKPMITVSSNYTTNLLLDSLELEGVNRFIQAGGFSSTVLNRRMLAGGSQNYTSASDCGRLLEQAWNGTYGSRRTSEELLAAMKAQSDRSKIPSGLPSGTVCYNKTGELNSIAQNDAAIICSPACDYILCVIVNDPVSVTKKNIAGLSKLIYSYLNP